MYERYQLRIAPLSDSRLFTKMANHIVSLDNLRIFSAQALTITVWAFAKSKESHPRLFKKVADHIIALDNLREFRPHALVPTQYGHLERPKSHIQCFSRR